MDRETTGRTLSHYQLLAPIGAGGMGEVYRARDPRLGRDVAVKILPAEFAADPQRLKRFDHEARAVGALNHPNILAVYDLGTQDGIAFLVTELLEGESLRARLTGGAPPIRRALEYATQIARGLAAAHEKGIIHRDLKPENLFVTRDGRVKILDFGLARQTRGGGPGEGAAASETSLTESGWIVGTAGYMAPEQVRGERVDHRADLFAFGCVLYELISGKRAFAAPSSVETMSLILNSEPPPLSETVRELPPGLEGIVTRCLEKDPALRFQNALDLAFQLEGMAGGSTSAPRRASTSRRRIVPAVGVALALAAAGAVVASLWIGGHPAPPPAYERLTFRRGSISTARYAPDGRSIVYSAAWDAEPGRIYTTRVDDPESSALPLPEARLLALSSSGDLAIAVGPGTVFGVGDHATLARVPLAGGAPRELLENVLEADWSPDGRDLAVTRSNGDTQTGSARCWLEYPIGHRIYTSSTGLLSPRVSRGGDKVALIQMQTTSDFTRGSLVVVDRAGHARRLTVAWETIQGIAWSKRGDEILFTASHRGLSKALYAVTLSGRQRLVLNAPGGLTLQDISPDGGLLLSHESLRVSTVAKAPGDERERDLTWQASTGAADISRDGRTLVFTEWGEAVGAASVIGMRGTDGSPVAKLGDGYAGGLSPDGRWVVAIILPPKPHLSMLPTGAGQTRDLDPGPVTDFDWACWAPDGRHVVFRGLEPGRGMRVYVQDVSGGPPRAFTPVGAIGGWHLVSPDSRWVLASVAGGPRLFPLESGTPRPVERLTGGDIPVCWGVDDHTLLVRTGFPGLPARIERLDLETGARHPVRTLMPADPAGVTSIAQIIFTPDERAYAYTYFRQLADLYHVVGPH